MKILHINYTLWTSYFIEPCLLSIADAVFSFNWTDEMSKTFTDSFYSSRASSSEPLNVYQKEYSGWQVRPKMIDPNAHIYNSMIAAFSSDVGSLFQQGLRPGGAVCQFQWAFLSLSFKFENTCCVKSKSCDMMITRSHILIILLDFWQEEWNDICLRIKMIRKNQFWSVRCHASHKITNERRWIKRIEY